jgi:hypothetical protein
VVARRIEEMFRGFAAERRAIEAAPREVEPGHWILAA